MDMQSNMIGMIAVARYSFRKILLSRKVFITILIGLFIGGVMGYAGSQDIPRLDGGTDIMDALILFFFMPVVAMIYGSSIIKDEVEDKSITQVITSPVDRAFSYLGYYLGLSLALSIVIAALMTTGFLAFFVQKGIDDGAMNIYIGMLLLGVIGSFVYSSLFLLSSMIFSRPIYFGLFYAFIWEGFIGSLPGKIKTVAIKHYLRSIGSEWIGYGSIHDYRDATALGTSWEVLLGFTLVMLIIGALVFRNKEFP